MRSLFRDIITTDDKHAVKATAVSPTKTYTPSRERERDWIIYITDISRFVMNAITIATMKNDNGPRGARFDASCRLLSNPLQGVEHIHNSLLPRAHYRKSSRWRSRKTELSMVERTAMNWYNWSVMTGCTAMNCYNWSVMTDCTAMNWYNWSVMTDCTAMNWYSWSVMTDSTAMNCYK